ncbi:hypothetical protein OUZ56_007726 [Daphnia magna]|uniref:Secreted protein n=1 Tax=Daphnia magna TaxID=35525 RepID=A0ABR0AAV2_9CRUS|nr:hypothetical protein OUZ56_007726 [Daphnia magna]
MSKAPVLIILASAAVFTVRLLPVHLSRCISIGILLLASLCQAWPLPPRLTLFCSHPLCRLNAALIRVGLRGPGLCQIP